MEDLSAFGQLLTSMIPQAREVIIMGRDAKARWCSREQPGAELLALAAGLLDDARRERPAYALRHEVATTGAGQGAAHYVYLLGDPAGPTAGAVAFSIPGPFDRDAPLPPEQLLGRIAALLVVIARDLDRDRALETFQQRIDDTLQFQWLHQATSELDAEGALDPIIQLLVRILDKLDADVVVANVPGNQFERYQVRPGSKLLDIDALQSLARGELLHLAQSRGESLSINKARTKHSKESFRFVSVPLRQQGAVVGVLTAFAHQGRDTVDARDVRVLELIAPRLLEQIELRVDHQTGLPTRAALDHYAAVGPRHADSSRCVVYVDLDQMHVLNDLFGFNVGDEVLRRVATLWPAGRTAPHGLFGRISGDRFAAVLDQCTLNQGRAWAEAARAAIARLALPKACGGFRLSASFGAATLGPSERFETALARAATACRAAKDRGRNRVELFTEDDQSLLQRRDDLNMFRDLLSSLEEQRFELLAQPLVPLSDPMRATHYEVLLRFLDRQGCELAPTPFLSAAKRYQLLPQLDSAVIKHALSEIAPYVAQLQARRTVLWLNVAGLSVSQDDFTDSVRTMIKSSGLPGQLLGFEITESAAIENFAAAARFIARLRELGCAVALDDFGTGFSSLAYLKLLQVHALKIDGAFIRDLLKDERSEALVAAVLDIARQLDLDTVAEYVENEATAARLRELGVSYGQGHYFAKPASLRLLLQGFARADGAAEEPAVARTRSA